jgi:hypothetical protein
MVQKLTTEQFEALEESDREKFAEFKSYTDDGVFYVPSEVLEFHSHETTALKKALDTERDLRRDAEKALKTGDTEAMQTAQAQLEAAQADLTEQRTTLETERDQFARDKQQFATDQVLDSAMQAHGAVADQLRPHLRDAVITLEDGTVVAKGEDGQPLVTESGDHVAVDQLVAQWRDSDKWANLFKSSQRSGGGSSSAADGGGSGYTVGTPHPNNELKTLQDKKAAGGNLSPRERLRMAQLTGAAPTSDQLTALKSGSVTGRF